MKVKLKNTGGAARFFLSHGEKLGMAAVVICASLLIWSSLGRERLDSAKQPPQLQQQATQASSHVEEQKWEDFAPEDRVVAVNYVSATPTADVAAVPADAFPNMAPINPPVVEPAAHRKDPPLLAPESPEARGGAGLWASADPEVIKRKMREAALEAQKEEKEDAKRRAEEDSENGGGRGGYGGGGYGGRGGYGGGRGGYGGGDFSVSKDGVIVMRPMGGAETQGFEQIDLKSWVTIVAKVPVKKQFAEYRDILGKSLGYSPNTDMPNYLGYEVERAEITDAGGDPQWKQVARVSAKQLLDKMAKWPTQSEDLINPKYKHPLLTHPLPPMVLREWGDEITHSDLPIPTEAELNGAEEEPERKPDAKKDKDDTGDDFASAGKAATAPAGAAGYGRGGYDGGRGGYGGGYGGGGRGGYGGGYGGGGRGGYGGGYGGGGRGGYGGGRGGAMGEAELPEYTWDERTPYVLFRYFDDTVEPGHRYRYRVRLALADVNGASVSAKFLDPSVNLRKEKGPQSGGKPAPYRFTDWSKPSSIASVPHAGLAYIVGAKPSLPTNLASEGTAQLVVKSLDSMLPAEAAVGGQFARGAVLNFMAKKAEILWSSAFEAEDKNGDPVNAPAFDFLTGLTVLDFAGGDPLNNSRELKAPAVVLFMDETGQMMIKNELEDQKPVKEYTGVLEAKKEQDRAANDRGGDGGYGGGRGGGGRGRR